MIKYACARAHTHCKDMCTRYKHIYIYTHAYINKYTERERDVCITLYYITYLICMYLFYMFVCHLIAVCVETTAVILKR